MTDAPPDLEEYSQQINADMAPPSSQLSNGAEDSEQCKAKMDLKASFAHLVNLNRNFHEEHFPRSRQCINACYDYQLAKIDAYHHRLQVRMQDPAMIDLDSATDTEMFHIGLMMDYENRARDACYVAVDFIRSELTALEEVLKMSSPVLRLANETSGNHTMRMRVHEITTWTRAQRKQLVAELDRFR